jgi:hypothetical protein
MSLYNMVNGVNPLVAVCLGLLDLQPGDVGRFRDAYFMETDGEPRIVVFTRNGGGNRDDYVDVFERLQQHPLYVRDWDDDYDCTYASIEFRVPPGEEDSVREVLAAIREQRPELLVAPMDRFRAAIEKLKPEPKK